MLVRARWRTAGSPGEPRGERESPRSPGTPPVRGDGKPRIARLPHFLRPRFVGTNPGPMPFLHAGRRQGMGGRARPPLSTASFLSRDGRWGPGRDPSRFPGRAPGPWHRTARPARARGGALGHRPSRGAIHSPRRARFRWPRRDPRRRGNRHRPAGDPSPHAERSGGTEPGAPGISRPHPLGGARALRLLGGPPGKRGRSRRPSRDGHRPALGAPARRRCERRGGLCVWPTRNARSRAPALRASRGRRGAGDGGTHGLWLRSLLRMRHPAGRGRIHETLRRRASCARRSDRQRPGAGIGALMDLSVRIGDLNLEHPVLNGSGTFDAIAARRAFGDALVESFPFSAFVSKTITPEPRAGNPPPRLFETSSGLVNSIGLPNKGLRGFLELDLPRLAELPVPLVVSVMGVSRQEFSGLVEGVAGRDEVAAVELNVSCPNVESGLVIGEEPAEALALLETLRPITAKPLIVKLSPNVADPAGVALAAEQGGA